jgi:hypothetical protein
MNKLASIKLAIEKQAIFASAAKGIANLAGKAKGYFGPKRQPQTILKPPQIVQPGVAKSQGLGMAATSTAAMVGAGFIPKPSNPLP